MTQEELIADTNRLLARLLEIDEIQRVESEEKRKEWAEDREQREEDRNERMREKLRERGVSEELLQGDNVDWEKRLQEVQEQQKKRIEEAKEREQKYKDDVLDELRAQTELLNRIAEKLGL